MSRFGADITSYKVAFARTRVGNGYQDFDYQSKPYRTYIKLKLSGPGGTPAREAHLYFVEPFFIRFGGDTDEHRELGSLNREIVTLTLEYQDFDHCYKILQSEKPLTFFWETDQVGRSTYIKSWKVSTGTDEPIGEGDSES